MTWASLALVLAPCAGPWEPGESDPPVPGDGSAQLPYAQPAPLPAPAYQASMASALPYRKGDSALITYRIPFTNMRVGERLQVAFWAHGGDMVIRAAWIGRWAGGGEVLDNRQLAFDGLPGKRLAPEEEAVTDPLGMVVRDGERLAISLEASGAVPAALDVVNDGVRAFGARGSDDRIFGPSEPAVRGVKWVAVFGPPQRVVAVLGDSIGAGMASGDLDGHFPAVAQWTLGFPVVDASVGGDGVEQVVLRLDRDLFAVPGVTDCVIQAGTNDLHREAPGFLVGHLSEGYRRLRAAGVRPWGATLLPKGPGRLTPAAEAARRRVNDFIRSTDLVEGVVDFAAFADPSDPSVPLPGFLARDGIHPSTQGHRLMGERLAETLRAR